MQARIPSDFRQSMKWFGELDAPALFSLCVGCGLGLRTLTGDTGHIKLRIVGAILWGVIGALFAFGKWPLERHGDRIWTWLRRGIEFLCRPRRASLFNPIAPRKRHSQRR